VKSLCGYEPEFRTVFRLCFFAVLLGASGCATAPYHYGRDSEYIHGYRPPAHEPQIVVGRPSKFLDKSGWMWPGSLLAKLILWNHHVDSHVVSTQTVMAIQQYLRDNDIRDVKVRINGYQVGDEWRRTFHNKAVGAGWRYTLGVLSCVQYTIMPGRFFGGDHYNPFANSINIYSDIIPVVLHESGHSKDFAQRTYKGTYGFLYAALPFFNLYPEAKATTEALSYLRAEADREQWKAGYKILYPAYGTYIGGGIGQFLLFPWDVAVQLGVVIPGHVVGRVKAARVPEKIGPQAKPTAAELSQVEVQ